MRNVMIWICFGHLDRPTVTPLRRDPLPSTQSSLDLRIPSRQPEKWMKVLLAYRGHKKSNTDFVQSLPA